VAPLSDAARLRLLVGVGLLSLALALEIFAFAVDPGACVGQRPKIVADTVAPVVAIGVPCLWVLSLVLFVWGRERAAFGGLKASSLALTGVLWLPASLHFLEPCFA